MLSFHHLVCISGGSEPPPCSSHVNSAVDVNLGSMNIARILRKKEENRPAHIVRCAEATQGDLLHHPLEPALRPVLPRHPGIDHPRVDAVDPDPQPGGL